VQLHHQAIDNVMVALDRRCDFMSAKRLDGSLCGMRQRISRNDKLACQIDKGFDFRLAHAKNTIGRPLGDVGG
jgi:hypothetical protein